MKYVVHPETGAWIPKGEYRRGPRRPGVHTRFKPFISPQIEPATARQLGLERMKGGGTAFKTERELNRYLAHEKAHGREVGWKDADYEGMAP